MSEADAIEQMLNAVADRLAWRMTGIVGDRVYTPEQAAELIGIDSTRKAKTIREIPRELLPDVPVTPGGRTVGYLGSDLLAYVRSRRRVA